MIRENLPYNFGLDFLKVDTYSKLYYWYIIEEFWLVIFTVVTVSMLTLMFTHSLLRNVVLNDIARYCKRLGDVFRINFMFWTILVRVTQRLLGFHEQVHLRSCSSTLHLGKIPSAGGSLDPVTWPLACHHRRLIRCRVVCICPLQRTSRFLCSSYYSVILFISWIKYFCCFNSCALFT